MTETHPTQSTISRRLALSTGAGALCVGFVSASRPIEPREAKLRAQLSARAENGTFRIRVSWLPSARRLSRDERVAALAETLNIPVSAIDMNV